MGDQTGNSLLYVADDDNAVCRSLALLLQSFGWQVQAFADGKQCLEAVLKNEPAAIVADLKMPVLGAMGLYNALVEHGQSIPMVILTVYGEARRHQRLPEGIVEFLDKPCDGEVLDDAIRRVISNMRRMVG